MEDSFCRVQFFLKNIGFIAFLRNQEKIIMNFSRKLKNNLQMHSFQSGPIKNIGHVWYWVIKAYKLIFF